MYDKLIEGYIQTLTENDVKDYVVKQGVAITDEEVKTVYQFVKNNYKELLKEDGFETLKQIKFSLNFLLWIISISYL